MTPQELKASILQLAIQGNLVEQHPEEGTGEELYSSIIFTEKKMLKPISDDEIPFDIPLSWKWIRHNELFEIVGGSQPPKSKFEDNPKEGYVRLFQIRDYGEKPVPVFVPQNLVSKFTKKGDILLARYGASVGKVFWAEDGAYNVAMAKSTPLFEEGAVLPEFVYYYYLAPLYQSLVRNNSRSAQAGFNKEDLNGLLFPLPPLAEQKRIVAKIEELLPLIDRYEQAWSKLEDFNKRFPVDMQKSILQMAIQGKLLEQRPEEGTGEDLFLQIQAEKQALIKAGTIKKEKSLPEITEDEIPFDIPDSWKWVRVGNLAVVQSSKRVFEKDYVSEGIPFFRSKEIGDLYRNEPIKTELFITEEHYKSLAEGYGVPKSGDILITSVGTIGNTWICDGRKFYYKDGNITQICGNSFFDSNYVEYFLHSPLFEKQALSTVAGTAYSALTIIKLKNLLIPLPPLAEQKRIVAKLEEILPLCERLK